MGDYDINNNNRVNKIVNYIARASCNRQLRLITTNILNILRRSKRGQLRQELGNLMTKVLVRAKTQRLIAKQILPCQTHQVVVVNLKYFVSKRLRLPKRANSSNLKMY